ncbi:hypothetical protein ACNQTS_31185, partial [Pseudomonas aeruginosa]|uniref:hypothetical protein n=1 Tax=Pseudomonas aeruginosa TaxID=287 RepID=UPI003F7EBD95
NIKGSVTRSRDNYLENRRFQAQLELLTNTKPPVVEATAPAEPVQRQHPLNATVDNTSVKEEEDKKRRNLYKYK